MKSWWSRLGLALASVVWFAGCGGESAGVCDDSACPAGWVCGENGCEPTANPTTTGDLGRFTSTALTSDGRLLVSTYDQTHKNLVVSVEQADGHDELQPIDGWRVEDQTLVDTDSGRWTAITVDANDTAHLVWFDVDGGQLRYAHASRASAWQDWAIETVDGAGPEIRGTHASIVASQGIVYVAYRDETARQLRYARRDADGSWTLRTIDPCAGEAGCPEAGAEDYGEWAQIAIIGQRPRIAFYDRYRGDLKMATRTDEGAWVTTTLDGRDAVADVDTGDVGRFISLALTPERHPALAYYDVSRGALRYLVPGSAPLVVDAGVRDDATRGAKRSDPVGQHAALAFDDLGRAVILYLDGGIPAVKQAVVAAGKVVSTRILDGLAPGAFFSFDAYGEGQLRGAYGAWLEGEAPRTRLVRFLIPVYATP
ncbi:MAG: hypothetical protein EP329_13930 [Deltaproteobacteria bacterium]|nr:MAG: hypothetical protein EP329_13930 [Deltaproteobacteria bacterium]